MVASWTGEYQYTIDQVIEAMAKRANELNLRLTGTRRPRPARLHRPAHRADDELPAQRTASRGVVGGIGVRDAGSGTRDPICRMPRVTHSASAFRIPHPAYRYRSSRHPPSIDERLERLIAQARVRTAVGRARSIAQAWSSDRICSGACCATKTCSTVSPDRWITI